MFRRLSRVLLVFYLFSSKIVFYDAVCVKISRQKRFDIQRENKFADLLNFVHVEIIECNKKLIQFQLDTFTHPKVFDS